MRAVWLEQYGDKLKARREWDTLAKDTGKDMGKHLWHIVASDRRNQIVIDKGRETEIEKARIETIRNALAKSTAEWELVKDDPEARVAKRDIRAVWFEIRILYEDESNEEIKPLVERAKALLKTNSKATG